MKAETSSRQEDSSRAPRGARIALVHANVPDKWHAMIQKGWQKYYWKPWKAY